MPKFFFLLYIIFHFFQCDKLKELQLSFCSWKSGLQESRGYRVKYWSFYFQFSKRIYVRGQGKFLSKALKQSWSLKQKNNWKFHMQYLSCSMKSKYLTWKYILSHLYIWALVPQLYITKQWLFHSLSSMNVGGKVLPKQSLCNS